jgi:hypothetical protein
VKFCRQCVRLAALFVAIILPTAHIHAQATTASIHGTVTDPSGAVLAKATVTALNTSTGISNTQMTDSKGYFLFPDLHIGGPYSVTVEVQGFQRFTATGIILNLSSARQVDAKLQVGASSQSVQVNSDVLQVETADVQLKSVIGSSRIEDLPTLGRDAVQLQKTAPGVVEASDREATFSTNGSQTQENSYLLDGTDINDILLNQPGIVVNPDALAEVNIISSTIDPQFSRNSGAIVDEALKSGTNQFHGSAFEFYRDTFLNNGNYLSTTRPPFHQNIYGGTLGGPIKTNRAFFFVAYQGLQNNTAQTTLTPVFSNDQRNGNFSADESQLSNKPIPFPAGLEGPSGFCPAGTPWNVCFPGSQIPSSAFNSIAINLLSKYVPAANYTSAGINYYNFNAPNTDSDNQGIARIDYQLSSKDALWGSAIFDSNSATNTLPLPSTTATGTGATLPGFAANNSSNIMIFNASWTHIFSSTMLNELRAGYFRFNYAELEPAASTIAQPSSFGFNIIPQDPSVGALPLMNVNGYFALGFSDNGPQPRIDQNYNYFDNFSKVAGNHDLKFGASVERIVMRSPFFTNNSGNFFFNPSATYSTGDPAADFLLGIPATYGQGSGFYVDVRAWRFYGYAQDHWKATNTLTLAYGTGYDVETPYANLQYSGVGVTCWYPGNQQSTVFTGAPPGTLYPGDPGCNKYGSPTTHWDHMSPRIGFAWSPNGGLGALSGQDGHAFAVRGGFGVYWNRLQFEGAQINSNDPPFSLNSVGAAALGGSPSFANPFQDVAGTPGASYPANPFPYSVPKPGQDVNFQSLYPLEMDNLTSDFDVPYTYNFNLNVQRSLPSNMVLTVGYVGSVGRRLARAQEGDPITQQGHNDCLSGTGTGAPITLGGQTLSCLQLIGSQSLFFPGQKLQPGVVPGSQIPGVFPNGVPYYLSIGGMHTSGASNYNSLQVSLTKNPTHGLYFSLAYTYSHALDNASSLEDSVANGWGINYVPGYTQLSYGDSTYDARNRFVALYNYEIPLPRMWLDEPIVQYTLGGWHFAGVTALQNGFPVTVYAGGVYNSLYCDQFSFVNCPDVPDTSTFNIKTLNPRKSGHYWFDTSTFSPEPIGTFGNVKRNFFHGPGFNYSNFEIYKNVPVGSESSRYLQLRLEAYNAFNHANFANPNGNYGAGPTVFGVITSVDQPINAGGDPQPARAIQLGAKFYF